MPRVRVFGEQDVRSKAGGHLSVRPPVSAAWLPLALAIALVAMAGALAMCMARRRRQSLRHALLDIANGMPNGVIAGTAREGEVTCNTAAIELLGLVQEPGLLRQRFRIDSHPMLKMLWADIRVDALQAGEPIEIIDQRGHYRQLECRVTACRFDGRILPMAMLIDRTDRVEADRLLEQSRTHDPLTGLANRELFHDRFTQALELAARQQGVVAVLVIKIDQFELVLERYGWDTAKRLLIDVALRLGNSARAMDTLARVGQNRFAVLLQAAGGRSLTAIVADRFRTAVAGRFYPDEDDGEPIAVSGSIGVALSGSGGATSLRLLEHATLACARARLAGGDLTLFFDQDQDVAPAIDDALSEEIRHGIEQGEFFVEYQPIVDLATRRISGFEALLRWRHPVRGIVPPASFIASAERSGLINALGEHVLATACFDASTWPYDVDVSVNASVVQLMAGNFPQRVEAALAKAGLAPSRLKIEVTETAAIPSLRDLGHSIGELRAMGVAVLLDDFGTGYSSLSQLCSLAFDGLKIEGQFIADLANPRTLAVVQMLIAYCRKVGLMVVAEGVETAAQLAVLRRSGCGHVQGYLVGRPVGSAEARDIVYRQQQAPAGS